MKKLHNLFRDLFVSECSCDKFTGSVRLITGRETTGEHDDLALADALYKSIYGISDISRILILEYEYGSLRTRTLKCLCGIVLTVGTREYGNEYLRLGNLVLGDQDIAACIYGCLHDTLLNLDLIGNLRITNRIGNCREDLLKSAGPSVNCFIHADGDAAAGKCSRIRNMSDHGNGKSQSREILLCHLKNDAAVILCNKVFLAACAVDGDTETVTEGHL